MIYGIKNNTGSTITVGDISINRFLSLTLFNNQRCYDSCGDIRELICGICNGIYDCTIYDINKTEYEKDFTPGSCLTTDFNKWLNHDNGELQNALDHSRQDLNVTDFTISTWPQTEEIRVVDANNGGTTIRKLQMGEVVATEGDLQIRKILDDDTIDDTPVNLRLQFETTDGIVHTISNITCIRQDDNDTGKIVISTGFEGETETLTLDKNGYVGINNTSPSSHLDVTGDIVAYNIKLTNVPASDTGLTTGQLYTKTASELGLTGTDKILCMV